MGSLPSLHIDVSTIVAHLFYAVGNSNKVVVTTVDGEFEGVLCYPEDEERVVITFSAPIPGLTAGVPICVEYASTKDEYRFYTEIVSAAPGELRARIPYAVESRDQRLTLRLTLPARSGFRIRSADLGAADLGDVSMGGVGFVNPTDASLRIGQILTGDLLLPGDTSPLSTCLEVRHLGLRRGHLHVGARFVYMSVRDRARLARSLARASELRATT